MQIRDHLPVVEHCIFAKCASEHYLHCMSDFSPDRMRLVLQTRLWSCVIAGLVAIAFVLPDASFAQNANSLVQNQLQQLQRNQQSQKLQKQWLRQRQANELQRKERALNTKQRILRHETSPHTSERGLGRNLSSKQRSLRGQQQQLRTRQQILRQQIRIEGLTGVR